MSPDFMIPIVALSLPGVLVFIHKHFRYKEKLLELQARGGSAPLLPAAPADKRIAELEARVQNLESIIVAMDSELGALPGRAGRDDLRRIAAPTAAPQLSANALSRRAADPADSADSADPHT